MIDVLLCWSCGKEHNGDLYDSWLKEHKVYYCECGGQVISNSGKVMGYAKKIHKCNICSKKNINESFEICVECKLNVCKEHFDEDNKTCLRCNTKIAPNFEKGDKFIMKYSFEGEIFTVEEVRGTLLRVKMNNADLYLNRYSAIKV